MLLSELFHEQSSRWGNIAEDHLQSVFSLVNRFVRTALNHVIADDQVRSSVQCRIRRPLDTNFQRAREELRKIILDEKSHPITYNHYYTDNIQNARADAAKAKLQESMDHAVVKESKGKLDLQKLSSSLTTRLIVNMTQQACVESLAALDAYYKVTLVCGTSD